MQDGTCVLLEAREVLAEVFGYPDFRPGQADAVAAVLSGRDAVVLLPTGSGKGCAERDRPPWQSDQSKRFPQGKRRPSAPLAQRSHSTSVRSRIGRFSRSPSHAQ